MSNAPRLMSPRRDQLEWQVVDLESLLPPDHRARMIWAAVERLDMSEFLAAIAARGSDAGRPAHDPSLLLALWLYATSEGVGSARHLARLCERDVPYRWLCGGVTPNHHSLSDFRVGHGDKLDALMTQILASLMSVGLLKLERVAQDGTRVRASAGAGSYRRGARIEQFVADAREQVATLRRELDADPAAATARQKGARERAARERLERLEQAMKELPKAATVRPPTKSAVAKQARSRKKKSVAKEPRVSTTDPEARVMKMANGGFCPAYNVQLATDVESRVIVGVAVTNQGTDGAQLAPMIEQIERRTGRRPGEMLVDGGYSTRKGIDDGEKAGVVVYAPVAASRTEGVDAYAPKPEDLESTIRWRTRMKSPEAKAIYKLRAATAETTNADLRAWRGLTHFRVRGAAKVRSISLLAALTYNILRAESLRRAA